MKNTTLKYRIEQDFTYLEEEDYYFATTIDGKYYELSGEMRNGILMFLNYEIDGEDQEISTELRQFMTYTCHDEHLEYLEKEAESKVDYQAESDYMNKQYESDKL